MRKGRDVRQPRLERAVHRPRRPTTHTDDRPPPHRERRNRACGDALATDAGALRSLPHRPRQQLGREVGHPGAVADPGAKKALGCELLEDRDHRVSCDTEFQRRRPGRRQSRAGLETSVENRRAQAVVDLSIERYAGPTVGVDTQRQKVRVSCNAAQWLCEKIGIGSFLYTTKHGLSHRGYTLQHCEAHDVPNDGTARVLTSWRTVRRTPVHAQALHALRKGGDAVRVPGTRTVMLSHVMPCQW